MKSQFGMRRCINVNVMADGGEVIIVASAHQHPLNYTTSSDLPSSWLFSC